MTVLSKLHATQNMMYAATFTLDSVSTLSGVLSLCHARRPRDIFSTSVLQLLIDRYHA
jgi:hypothetical protein